jgi:uncharacterized protein with NAD-binding domain and iron-sulfur cluster
MNERITAASATLFVRTLRTAFLGSWNRAALALPAVGLSDLLVKPAAEFIVRHGGTIKTNADVVKVFAPDGRATHVRLRNGTEQPCDALILAVPSDRISRLLPDCLMRTWPFDRLEEAPVSPIISIHLWFETDFMPMPVVGVIGKTVQWVFNRRKICPTPQKKGGHVSAVISAAREFVKRTNNELVRIAADDLRAVFGNAWVDVKHAVVIREKRATFCPSPAFEHLRPAQTTSLENVFLAGDWTATGYPATLEGAVLSGDRCCEHLLDWLLGQRKVANRS